ncbi:ABC transporter ATP-binding protein [Clostridium sp.]|uniref:ABC transporter ATP-binding protein n=1 Tax=Clostridium sp. TaxID=1506 RepID=UPI003217258F
MIIFMTIATLLVSIEPKVKAKIINLLFQSKYNLAINMVLLLVFIYLGQVLTEAFKFRILTKVDCNVCKDIRSDLFSKILNFPIQVFDNTETGELLSRMNNDIEDISNVFANYSISLLDSLFVVIFIGVSMISLNVYLFLIIVATFPITLGIFKWSGKKVKKEISLYKQFNDQCYGIETQCFTGIREIVSLGIRDKMENRLGTILDKATNQAIKSQYITIKGNMLVQAVNYLDMIIFIFIAIVLISLGKIGIEEFITFLSYSILFSNSLSSLTKVNAVIQKLIVSLKRIYDLNNNLNFNTNIFGNKDIQKEEKKVELKNVSFGYNDKNVIRNLNISFDGYGKYVIVGESGSGKSTIFNLLLRFYDNYDGEILINEINIRAMSEQSLRNNISVVMQEPYLFNLSIKDNLLLGNSCSDMNEIERVCSICNIHKFIMGLPNKYDTVVCEGGVGLSVGQKQRIAIARALLRKTSILLLDEITSALDNDTEESINELINYISKDHIVIIITHRLKGVSNAKGIFVMNEGQIMESGSHKELMNYGSLYKNLFLKGRSN